MKAQRYTSAFPAVGSTSLLVIFAVICLAVFSVLTLSTAQAQLRLAQSTAASSAAYYEADTKAEYIFARLRNGEIPDGVHWDGNLCSYQIPVSPNQTLQVQLQKELNSWTVLRWQIYVHATPEISQTISLWDGNTMQEDAP